MNTGDGAAPSLFRLDSAEIFLDKGVLKDDHIRQQILDDIVIFAKTLDLTDIQLSPSILKGPKGNQETFPLAKHK